ncbi:MAG: L-serine ammonia-lyase, iron-sulfur-dependent, subunit alpha, partial [Rickettsiales bacterium]|nr:L-serine ammonia-lyase, iron-sulfur-dependent, subunit alpha [Rickettsiales bacterium]
VITATINYYSIFHKKIASFLGFKKFILTAGAVGILCKRNASISGAEGGCQAEIGSATAMAAAGLCAALGGSTEQCENAAIIGLSHNLGLTCDPIGGLVQIPCIERNAINTVKAVAACRLAMLEKESIYLRLDQIIETMRDTGRDMPNQYKETAIGGLAKNAKVGRHHNCGNCEYCS